MQNVLLYLKLKLFLFLVADLFLNETGTALPTHVPATNIDHNLSEKPMKIN